MGLKSNRKTNANPLRTSEYNGGKVCYRHKKESTTRTSPKIIMQHLGSQAEVDIVFSEETARSGTKEQEQNLPFKTCTVKLK